MSNNHYSITSSLNERTIYVRIVNTQSYMCYEGNIDAKELRLNLELADIHKILEKCFAATDENFKAEMSVNNNVMKIVCKALIGGFLRVGFEFMLREKLMSNDGQLTFNFTRLEQELAQAVTKLEKRCESLSNENELLLQRLSTMPVPILIQFNNYGWYTTDNGYYFMNETRLELSNGSDVNNNAHIKIMFKNIKCLHQLKYLKISTVLSDKNFKEMQSNSLEELVLNLNGANDNLTSLQGIQQRLPNLRSLTVWSAPTLKDIPTVLKSEPHKITKICIKSCAAVNTVEMQTYCQTSGIELEIA